MQQGGWLGIDAVLTARERMADLVRHTPILTSRSLGERAAAPSSSRRRTSSGPAPSSSAARWPSSVPVSEGAGVVAGSAGNHAQSVAYAARARGIPCEVFMPAGASVAKVAAVRGFGGIVHLGGDSVDECVALARDRAARPARRSSTRSTTRT